MSLYKPLEISTDDVYGVHHSFRAMRYPMAQRKENPSLYDDIELGRRLVRAGDSHAKCMRGIDVWFTMKMQVGFMLEFDTYRIGIDCLSSSSQMHTDLKGMSGAELAERKQENLPYVQYIRGFKANYQALRNMYHQRRNHRHPDWQVFCDWVETLPMADKLIIVRGING